MEAESDKNGFVKTGSSLPAATAVEEQSLKIPEIKFSSEEQRALALNAADAMGIRRSVVFATTAYEAGDMLGPIMAEKEFIQNRYGEQAKEQSVATLEVMAYRQLGFSVQNDKGECGVYISPEAHKAYAVDEGGSDALTSEADLLRQKTVVVHEVVHCDLGQEARQKTAEERTDAALLNDPDQSEKHRTERLKQEQNYLSYLEENRADIAAVLYLRKQALTEGGPELLSRVDEVYREAIEKRNAETTTGDVKHNTADSLDKALYVSADILENTPEDRLLPLADALVKNTAMNFEDYTTLADRHQQETDITKVDFNEVVKKP
ncbi:MAG: hypothetical protein PHC51_05770 [bacterium]|nr:hypothetical protein [bacterium]